MVLLCSLRVAEDPYLKARVAHAEPHRPIHGSKGISLSGYEHCTCLGLHCAQFQGFFCRTVICKKLRNDEQIQVEVVRSQSFNKKWQKQMKQTGPTWLCSLAGNSLPRGPSPQSRGSIIAPKTRDALLESLCGTAELHQ